MIKTGLDAAVTDRLEQSGRAQARDVGRVLRHVEADSDVALSAQVINLIRVEVVNQVDQLIAHREIAIVQVETHIGLVGILIDMVNPPSVECTGPADDSVDVVAAG